MFKKRDVSRESLFRALNSSTFNSSYNDRCLIYTLAKDNLSMIKRMKPLCPPLNIHNGCVNSICWNDSGTKILSGSDDQCIKIVDPFNYKGKVLVDYKTCHRSNIFSARFLPFSNDSCVISAAGDGGVLFTDLNAEPEYNECNKYVCHEGTCYKILTVPDEPHTFMSCGEDGTIRCYDLRIKQSCNCADEPLREKRNQDVIIWNSKAVSSMAVNPRCSYELAIGVADSSVKIYDRRNLPFISSPLPVRDLINNGNLVRYITVPELDARDRYYRITSVQYNSKGTEILASFSSEYIYLFSLTENTTTQICTDQSHDKKSRQPATMKRLRLRGDWSDTGPLARPNQRQEIGQARPTLHSSLMERMTLILSQMLNQTPQNPGRRNQRQSQEHESSGSEYVEPSAVRSASQQDEQNPLNILTEQFFEGASSHEDDTDLLPSSTSLTGQQSHFSNIGNPVSSNTLEIASALLLQQFKGHRNARTMIKEVNFWGDNYICSGSDCGHIFFWSKSGELVNIIEADTHVVNCVQSNPYDLVLASSGIDYSVKLWAPVNEESSFDSAIASELTTRNELLLEETKDTITVPAAFMVRMLNCLNSIRREAAPAPAAQSHRPPSPQGENNNDRRDEEGEGGSESNTGSPQ